MNKKLYCCDECGQTIFVKRKPKKCPKCDIIFAEFYKVEVISLK